MQWPETLGNPKRQLRLSFEGTFTISNTSSVIQPIAPIPPKTSLAANLLRVVLTIYLSLAILLTLGQLGLEYQNEKRRLTEEIENAATTFRPIISQALWNVDEEQTIASLRGVLGINYDVLNVQLWDAGGELLYEFESPATKRSFAETWPIIRQLTGIFIEHYTYEYDLYYESEFTSHRKIGHLVLTSNSNVILNRASHTFLITIISAIFKTLLLASIFFIIMRKLVDRPLKQITYAMSRLDAPEDSRDPAAEQEPQLLSREDELGAMVKTFREMAQSLKQKDRSLNAYANHLESKVQERTLQLEQASQAKSDFLAAVSHEIRTPMNGIIGLAHLLGETQLDAQQRQYIEVIQNSGESLITIINEILDHLKSESNKIELEETPFCLEDIFNQCVALFSHKSRETNIRVKAFFPPHWSGWVIGDPTRIRQVLMNLLGNAFKFTKDGTITVKAEITELCKDTSEVEISVTDTGIGIEQSQFERLFKPFSQADSSTTRRYGGTGLGLAICKQLVELMGGNIGVTSEAGEGSQFWFKIPLKTTQAPKASKAPNTAFAQAWTLVSDKDYRHHLQQLCEHAGLKQFPFQDFELLLQKLPSGSDRGLVIIESCAGSDPSAPTLPSHRVHQIRAVSALPILLIQTDNASIEDTAIENCNAATLLRTPFTNASFFQALGQLSADKAHTLLDLSSREEPADLSALRVMVAEDNLVNQMVITGYLERFSIHPVVVEDGLQALHYCEQNPHDIDLILMDGEMPKMDGWQASHAIRKLGIKNRQGQPITIAALTAHAVSTYQEKATEHGMDQFLSKPIDPGKLKQLLLETYRHSGNI